MAADNRAHGTYDALIANTSINRQLEAFERNQFGLQQVKQTPAFITRHTRWARREMRHLERIHANRARFQQPALQAYLARADGRPGGCRSAEASCVGAPRAFGGAGTSVLVAAVRWAQAIQNDLQILNHNTLGVRLAFLVLLHPLTRGTVVPDEAAQRIIWHHGAFGLTTLFLAAKELKWNTDSDMSGCGRLSRHQDRE